MAKKKATRAPRLPAAPAGTVDEAWPGGAPSGPSASTPAASSSSSASSGSRVSSGGGGGGPTPGRDGGGPSIRATVPTVVDMSKARHEALFQLRLGRQALAFGFLVGMLLIVDSAVALFVGSNSLASRGQIGTFLQSVINTYLPLALPLAAALFLSVAVFIEKYDTYGFWPPPDHFAITVGALTLSVALVAIYVDHLVGRGPDLLATIAPFVYELVLIAISLGMVSLGTTWRGRGWRKLLSLALAAAPPVLAVPLSFSLSSLSSVGAPGGQGALNLSLSIAFSFAAFLYTASGAQLHLMASATRAQEREVVAGSHENLFALSRELAQRGEAAAFREEALSRREADVEAQEAAQLSRARFLEERRGELETLEQHLRTRSEETAGREQALLPKAAEVAASEASQRERAAQLDAREHELHGGFQRLGDREKNLLDREQGLGRRELEAQNRLGEASRAEALSRSLEQTAQTRLQEAERRFAQAANREAEAQAKANAMVLPANARAAVQAKEMELANRSAQLEAQKAESSDRIAAAQQKEQAVEKRRLELQHVAATILEREKAVASLEAGISVKERQYETELELLKGATRRHEEEIRRFYDSTKRNTLAESQSTLKLNQLNEREKDLLARETKVREAEGGLQARREEVERNAQEMAARQRSVEAQAADLRIRSSRLEEATARLAPSKNEFDASLSQALRDRERALELREKQLADREQKLRAMAYERDRPAGGPASEEPGPSGPGAGTGSGGTRPGRAGTGTPRLDDLLLGGFPERAHAAFVGPAFVGKEVAIYSFLAEGLRKGQSALVVATSRAPGEMAKEMGIVVPSLMEYEAAGRLVWIDASNPTGAAGTDHRATRGSTVKGPADLAGILQAVARHSLEFEKREAPYRVAFLSLSACMTQTDDKGAAAFVQNVLGILRPRNALGVYSVDRGMHSQQQVEAIVSQMDGAIEFRSERGKNQLQVLGLGEVQSRQWVDYRYTQRAIQLGSFSLERIR